MLNLILTIVSHILFKKSGIGIEFVKVLKSSVND